MTKPIPMDTFQCELCNGSGVRDGVAIRVFAGELVHDLKCPMCKGNGVYFRVRTKESVIRDMMALANDPTMMASMDSVMSVAAKTKEPSDA